MHIHTGEHTNNCGTCGISFTKEDHLTEHMLFLSGDRSYSCGACGKSFTLKQSLSQHMIIHTRDKQLVCETYGNSFISKRDIERHLFIHTGEKTCICEICGKCLHECVDLQGIYLLIEEINHIKSSRMDRFVQRNAIFQHIHLGKTTFTKTRQAVSTHIYSRVRTKVYTHVLAMCSPCARDLS